MPRGKATGSELKVKEMELKDAQREFSRRRGRGSKYDAVLDAVEKLGKGKAIIIEQVSYSEVTGIRNRLRDFLGDGFKVEATKVNKDKELYDVLIHRSE